VYEHGLGAWAASYLYAVRSLEDWTNSSAVFLCVVDPQNSPPECPFASFLPRSSHLFSKSGFWRNCRLSAQTVKMKIFEASHVFDHSWDQVSAGIHKKYPNEVSTHVVAVDVLNRELTKNGNLHSERLLTCRQNAPRWIVAMFGGNQDAYVREVSEIDLRKKTITIRSTNMTWANIINVEETVTYRPSTSHPTTQTNFEQDAKITAFGAFSKLRGAMEDFVAERFGQNASKGQEGFDRVLQRISRQHE